MASRWFIPLSLFSFAILVAVLWMYLSATQEPAPTAWLRSSPNLLSEPAVPAAPPADQSGDREGTVGARTNRRAHLQENPSPPRRIGTLKARSTAKRPVKPVLPMLAERLDEALVQTRLAVADSAFAEIAAGRKAMGEGRTESALRAFDQVLAKSPGNTAALGDKAAALVALQRWDDAESIYRQLVGAMPRDAAVRYNYGVVLTRRSKFGEAAEQFLELVAIDPAHLRGQYNLASLAQRAGRLSEARAAWEAYTRLEPGTPSVWFNLGMVWIDFDEPVFAGRCFAIYTALQPGDPDGHLNLAACMADMTDSGAALAELQQADQLSPCNEEIAGRLADLSLREPSTSLYLPSD